MLKLCEIGTKSDPKKWNNRRPPSCINHRYKLALVNIAVAMVTLQGAIIVLRLLGDAMCSLNDSGIGNLLWQFVSYIKPVLTRYRVTVADYLLQHWVQIDDDRFLEKAILRNFISVDLLGFWIIEMLLLKWLTIQWVSIRGHLIKNYDLI